MLRSVALLSASEPWAAFRQAQEILAEKQGNAFSLTLYEAERLDETEALESCEHDIGKADFIIISLHGTMGDCKGFDRLLPLMADKKLFFQSGMDDENREMAGKMHLFPDQVGTIRAYYQNADPESLADLFRYVGEMVFHRGIWKASPPRQPKWDGIYDPETAPDEEGSLRRAEDAVAKGQPVIGILFHRYLVSRRHVAPIDALAEKLRSMGAYPLCVYSHLAPEEGGPFRGAEDTLKRYFLKDGKPRIGCIINLCSFSLTLLAKPGWGNSDEPDSLWYLLGIPVLQVMSSPYGFEEWQNAPAGIPPQYYSSSVFHPEFDGQLISFSASCTGTNDDGNEPTALPIPERVDRVCRLAINWARLALIPNREKRIALILHNMPPRNDCIGCAMGLDTPGSLMHLLAILQEQGYHTDYAFRDGEDIIQRITAGLTNDTRWCSPEGMREKSAGLVSGDQYGSWFAEFPPAVQEKLAACWGPPPGNFLTSGDTVLVPGILNGNIFIGLQPPRGLEDKAEELVHSPDIVCPHQYLAFYRWISRVFGAHGVIHVGTHGTLEWLPGKEVSLSGRCYPDIAIDALPNIYPYIISNPGEGTQAKRRSYCALVDHLIPSMIEGGSYDELSDLDDMMKEYYHFKQTDPPEAVSVGKRIWELARKAFIISDIGLSDADAEADLDTCVSRIHAWTARIARTEIRDGLHILGQIPQGERFRNLLRLLLRVKNGAVPSLREGLCAAAGLDLDHLLANPAALVFPGKTCAMVLEDLDALGRDMFLKWEHQDYTMEAVEAIIRETFPAADKNRTPLLECLGFAAREIKPRLSETGRELDSIVKALEGRMVPTGPSGNPSRGNAHILPTGKNFYAIDPGAIPSRSAWETGIRLGEDLLLRYRGEAGRLPESIAILVYATDTMRTTGDDIAEILYLLGIRPRWLGNSSRVIGLEAIPLSELGRPRIDVTLRITGLFRDTFPNLIERIEDALIMAASLDESPEENYIKKHIETETMELIRSGVEKERALERASLRIFGDPPGVYGAGVAELVSAKKWKTQADLAGVYTAWGCHGYGKKLHGEKHYDDFSRRLSKTDVSVKNEPTVENDMMGSDDFYNYFGGLVSAVSSHAGKMKASFIPNSADRERPEVFSLHEEASRIMRARINNPRWIAGLKQHGYKGAQDISEMIDIVFGWDATTSVIDDWMYDAIASRYVFDEENALWIREHNPWAMQNISERLLEAVNRGMWNASQETVEKLRSIYMEIEGAIEDLN
ncbi:MAG: cobaltochelatase subunit CobN [Treponema sp.]|jgi:cobaltochelatase CobN|nr:cobaltochelatase subunit CobN [Treponema sp.]